MCVCLGVCVGGWLLGWLVSHAAGRAGGGRTSGAAWGERRREAGGGCGRKMRCAAGSGWLGVGDCGCGVVE